MGDIWVNIWHENDKLPTSRDVVAVYRWQGKAYIRRVSAAEVPILHDDWANIIQWAYADDFLQSIGLDDEPTSNS
jgi:hypothetical protein